MVKNKFFDRECKTQKISFNNLLEETENFLKVYGRCLTDIDLVVTDEGNFSPSLRGLIKFLDRDYPSKGGPHVKLDLRLVGDDFMLYRNFKYNRNGDIVEFWEFVDCFIGDKADRQLSALYE